MKKLLFMVFGILLMSSCGEKKEVPVNDEIVIISTEFGDLYLALYDRTPIHKENFLKLAREGFYDSTTFHRVMTGFMIQGGDPNSKDNDPENDGLGGPGYTLEAEIDTGLIHKKGALAAARYTDSRNPERRSNGSQFYIVHGSKVNDAELDQIEETVNNRFRQKKIRAFVSKPEIEEVKNEIRRYQQSMQVDSIRAVLMEVEEIVLKDYEYWEYSPEQRSTYQNEGGAPFLDQNYTIFGEVIEGLDIIDSIAVQQKDSRNRPMESIPMTVTVQTLPKTEITEKYGYRYR